MHHGLVLVFRSRQHDLQHALLDDGVDFDAGRPKINQLSRVLVVVFLDLLWIKKRIAFVVDAKLGHWLIFALLGVLLVHLNAGDVDVQARAIEVLDFEAVGRLNEALHRVPMIRLKAAHFVPAQLGGLG